MPGVRGELTTSLALQDRVRERLEAGAETEAVEDAQRLLALAEDGGGAERAASVQLFGDTLYASGRFGEAEPSTGVPWRLSWRALAATAPPVCPERRAFLANWPASMPLKTSFHRR